MKMLTRTLRYRFTYLPSSIKKEIVNSYRSSDPSFAHSDDMVLFEKEIGSIVMQMISVITNKGDRGELWLSQPGTQAREEEETWSNEDRLKRWVRNLDSNLQRCDDTLIIQKILMRVIY